MSEAKSRIQCLDRAISILEALAFHGDMTATQLADVLQLKSATIHNILTTLAAHHYLVGIHGCYTLGPGLAGLMSQWSPLTVLPHLAQAAVKEVEELTGESVFVGILSGYRQIMVAQAVGRQGITVQSTQSEWSYPLELATGRVLAAFCDERIRLELIRRQLEKGTIDGLSSNKKWETELAAIKNMGLSLINRPETLTAVAVPVYGPGGILLAALGVSCPSMRADKKNLAAMRQTVENTARNLSAALGAESEISDKTVRPLNLQQA